MLSKFWLVQKKFLIFSLYENLELALRFIAGIQMIKVLKSLRDRYSTAMLLFQFYFISNKLLGYYCSSSEGFNNNFIVLYFLNYESR